MIPKITLAAGKHKRLLQGHLWVFSNEIKTVEDGTKNGGLVDIVSHDGQFLGRGFYHKNSLIAARILSTEKCAIDSAFFARRIRQAQSLRQELYPGQNAYRLIFGESDALPGLVVDRYNNSFVVQSYCLGIDELMPIFLQALQECFTCQQIVLKNTSSIRELEQLPLETKLVLGENNFPLTISQDSLQFLVDPMQGQKSGFFFDQRQNRQILAQLSKDKTVLDCYSYSGGFALYALRGGAKSVVAVDSSSSACELIKKNFEMNKLKGEVICRDAEKQLQEFVREKKKFDIIVLDPPALAKSKKNFYASLRKYEQLNALAMQCIVEGGFLVTSSCSHHVDRNQFMQLLAQSARQSKRSVQIIQISTQAQDHPILPSMPETEYLKCIVARII